MVRIIFIFTDLLVRTNVIYMLSCSVTRAVHKDFEKQRACLEATGSSSRLECVCYSSEKSHSEKGIVIVLSNYFRGPRNLQAPSVYTAVVT